MLRRYRCFVFIGLLFSVPAFGDLISVGNLSLFADSPVAGDQEIVINNLTGSANCYSAYPACTSLVFTDWTLTVTFSSTYYSGAGNTGTGPLVPSPYVATDNSFGDITPSSTNNVFSLDLCGGVNIGNNCTPTTTITSIEFAGEISPASFCLYDPTVPGCNTVTPETFFANAAFDLVWNDQSPVVPYVDETTTSAYSPDIQVSSFVAAAPEPGSFFLLIALLPLARFARRPKSPA